MTERSTEARRRQRESEDNFDSRESEEANPKNTPRRRRRLWPWALLILLALIFFLPTIVMQTALKQKAIDWALADFKGKITADSISTGWFSPTKISGLKAVDLDGQTLMEVANVSTSKNLLGLATSGNDFGEINVSAPKIFLQLRPDGSNLEDALAEYLKPTDEPPTDLPHVKLNLIEGEVHVSTTSDSQTWLIDNLTMTSEVAGNAAALIADISCQAHAADQPPGNLELQVALDAESKQILVDNGTCQIRTQTFPASILVPAIQRVVGPCNAAGQIDGVAQISFSGGATSAEAKLDRMTVSEFAFVAPEYLKNDQIWLNRLVADGQIKITPGAIEAVGFETVTDVGKVTTTGQLDFAQLTSMVPTGEVPQSEFMAHGDLDLARVAKMLPETLGLHKDLQVESGTIAFDAATRSESGVRRLNLNLGAANLTARRGAEMLNWHQPLNVSARVAQTPNQVTLEDLTCKSDFVSIKGSANSQVGNFQVTEGDLAKLKENLSQFVDFTGVDMAGTFNGEFGWSFKQDPNTAGSDFNVQDRPVQIGGRFELDRPVIQMPDYPRWAPPKMVVVCNAAGKSSSDGTISINSGGGRVAIDQEIFTARLAQQVPDIGKVEAWNLNCDVKGRLDGWLAHIRNFIYVGDFEATGILESTFAAAVNTDKVVLNNVQYNVKNMTFDGYGASFTEPEVVGDTRVSYDLNSGLIFMPVINLACSSVSGRGTDIRITANDVIDWSGDVVFRADMNRVTNWFGISPEIDSVNWFGTAEGNVQLVSDQNALGGQVTAVINELVAAQRQTVEPSQTGLQAKQVATGQSQSQPQWTELFREKQVDLDGLIGMAQDFDSISFSKANVNASAVQLSADGTISDLAGAWETNIQGQWNPDWDQIEGLLDAYTYETVKLSGNGRQEFVVNGPLYGTVDPALAAAWIPANLKAQTRFAWDVGQVLNLPLGASQVSLDLNQSVAFLNTSEIPFVGGTLQVAPIIDLRGEEPYLHLEQGSIVNNINLSSDVCRDFLKYVTPLVADATAAQGKLTVTTEGAQVPLYDPMKAQVRGTLQLQQGSIGAGPLAKQLFTTVQQVKQLLKPGQANNRELRDVWMDLGDQEIPFAIQDGRVYHNGIRITIDDVVMQTEGFVGLDQTLNLVAEIPIADEWLGDSRWLAGLRGQSLQIPIGGTVSQPRLDTQAIQQLSRQLVQQAAGSAINDVVQEKTGEVQNRLQEEVQGVRQKLNNKIQEELQESIGGELQKGLEGLFKRGGGN